MGEKAKVNSPFKPHRRDRNGFHGEHDSLTHRGGLRAEILDGGAIRVGDPIEPIEVCTGMRGCCGHDA